MKIRERFLGVTLVLLTLLWAGCSSSVMAPQVDLPAPIAGNITTSAPDADGNVHIMGAAGAVPGGSMLMAVNEAATSAKLWRIFDGLIASAYAQEILFPSICELIGHACTVAAEDGSFELVIPAAIGDALTIGIIDPTTGEFISELLSLIVPELFGPTTACANLGLTGKVVDMKIVPGLGVPVLLKQGSDTTSNQLVIGQTSPTAINIGGCYAHSLAINENAGIFTAVVTSKSDQLLWVGQISDRTIPVYQSFPLSGIPMHVAFVNPSEVIVAMRIGSSVQLALVSLADGAIQKMAQPMTRDALVDGLTESVRLDIMPMDPGVGHSLGLLVSNRGSAVSAFVTLFQADGLSHISTWSIDAMNASKPSILSPENVQIESITDAALFAKPLTAGVFEIHVVVLDASGQNNKFATYAIFLDPQAVLQAKTNLAPFVSQGFNILYDAEEFSFGINTGKVRNVVISTKLLAETLLMPTAIVSDVDGNLSAIPLDSGVINGPHLLASQHDIVAIAVDDLTRAVYGADATDGVARIGSQFFIWQ